MPKGAGAQINYKGVRMIELDTLIQIFVGIFVIGGGIISFFVMQKGQNMKIKQLQIDITKLEKKQSKSTEHQIETEGLVREINVKLEHIMSAIDDLKRNGQS